MKIVGHVPLIVWWSSAVIAATAVSLRGDHERSPTVFRAESLVARNGSRGAEFWPEGRYRRHVPETVSLATSMKRRTVNRNARQPPKDTPIIDGFVITYWGIVLGVMVGLVVWSYIRFKDESSPRVCQEEKSFDLPENMWSAYLIAAMDQAHFRHNNTSIPPCLIFVLAITMGCLQMFTIFLIVHDINPDAEPVTSVPDNPWKQSTWTINCMKWLMVLFLVMGLIPEVSDSQEVIRCMLEVQQDRIDVPFWTLWVVTLFHYTITLLIIWGGVNAILSFAAVPDIVYSSLAITFLAHIDDMSYQFFMRLFGVKASFTIHYNKGERTRLPSWMEMLMKMMLILPLFWGMFLIYRAYMTNVMPSGRARYIIGVLSRLLGLD